MEHKAIISQMTNTVKVCQIRRSFSIFFATSFQSLFNVFTFIGGLGRESLANDYSTIFKPQTKLFCCHRCFACVHITALRRF